MKTKAMRAIAGLMLAVVILAAIGGCKSKESARQNKRDAGPASKPALVENAGSPASSLSVPRPATAPSTRYVPPSDTAPRSSFTLDLGNKVTMKLVLIPAGKFMMGSPETEEDREKDEVQHEVTISKPFYMGVTHVTVDQFAAFVKDSGYKTDAEKGGWSVGFEIKDGKFVASKMDGCSWCNPSFDQKGDHPVVQVSWNDAKAFCDWLSKKSGKMVQLPTEAQWEYACRAGTTTAYPWGDDPDAGKGWANCADQSLKKRLPNAPAEWKFFSWDDGFVFTSPVGSFKANAFGLYDMIGNAWEWCQDRYGDYDKEAATDPTGVDTGKNRVLRGGSWLDVLQHCRSARRFRFTPDLQITFIGFRVSVVAGAAERATQPAAEPSPQSAEQLTLNLSNNVTMKLVLIPPGKFMMGSPETEEDRNEDEVQHEVTISKAFYMGVTHVTVDQFAAFVKDSGYKTDAEKDGWSRDSEIKDGEIDVKKVDGRSWRNLSFDQKGDHPVVQVSWNDAKAFCDWLSKRSGRTVGLPTEAQWEYACRAGTKTAYPWGNDPDAGKGWANCADQSLKKKLPNAPADLGLFSWDDGFAFTSPVGSFKANAFGLYDMIGNAWEWCQDRYGDYDKEAATDPTGADTGTDRVLRGGGWHGHPRTCRSAARVRFPPDVRDSVFGFRVSVDLK